MATDEELAARVDRFKFQVDNFSEKVRKITMN